MTTRDITQLTPGDTLVNDVTGQRWWVKSAVHTFGVGIGQSVVEITRTLIVSHDPPLYSVSGPVYVTEGRLTEQLTSLHGWTVDWEENEKRILKV